MKRYTTHARGSFREDNLWFTKGKDSNTLYVFITGLPDWKRGDRKQFVLHSVQATDETEIAVLGHAGLLSEYAPDVDPQPRWEQTDKGLKISVCRAQRLYNNHKWHNPVVVKLTNIQPAIDVPPYAETGRATPEHDGTVVLSGKLLEMAGADEVEVGFELQEYLGFAEATYNTQWQATTTQKLSAPGKFQLRVRGLKPGTQYQFRAVVRHPKLTVHGDHQQFTAR